jgi:hypothetical protein
VPGAASIVLGCSALVFALKPFKTKKSRRG